MNDKDFQKMDETLMKETAPLREKGVSKDLLKGFSESVERRILAGQEAPVKRRRSWAPAWAPAMAVMILASVVVLRGPVSQEAEIDEDIAILKELGAWNESDETLLGASEEMDAQILELLA